MASFPSTLGRQNESTSCPYDTKDNLGRVRPSRKRHYVVPDCESSSDIFEAVIDPSSGSEIRRIMEGGNVRATVEERAACYQAIPEISVQYYRHITDPLQSSMYLFHPVDLTVDRLEFQTLKRLKQTSVSSFTRSRTIHASHTWAYCPTLEFVKQPSGQEKLKITFRDKLCVALYRLCHYLG
ncbi:hypothetical protein L596_000601 [Steinernema carpocapsae]|uniref:Uncharacterized protein n=1 Tax=Steinernema carpocapsae TaxID=34508 RepID=A0A4U8UIK1_STECR|nr:hypothetical protein L596_000601 [Steinernema carpocapsae]